MRLPRLRRWLPKALAVVVLLFIYAAWPGSTTFTVSKETTYVTEPLDANGFVDYPKALNQRLSEGITPENNANVLILKALGPRPEGAELAAEYYEWLKIDPPPATGEYAVSASQYFEKHLKNPPNDIVGLHDEAFGTLRDWTDAIDRARRWPWRAKDQPDVAKWLKQNGRPLAIIYEATERPQYYNPLVAKNQEPQSFRLLNSLLPTVQRCRDFASALSCRAMNRVAEGNFDGAWSDLMVCQRLGRLIAQGGTLIEGLVGLAIVDIAMNAKVTLLSHSSQTSKQILTWLEDVRKLPKMKGMAERLDLAERLLMLDVLMTMVCRGHWVLEKMEESASGKPFEENFWPKLFTFSIDYDPAFKMCNDFFDRCVLAARLPERADRKPEMEKLIDEVKQMKHDVRNLIGLETEAFSKSTRGEGIGKILLSSLLPAFPKVQHAVDRIEQTEQNLQVAFALAAYRADHRRYPATLNELAPKYLAKIPFDMFSGELLIYLPTDEGYLLYSVGINEIDEGRWKDDRPPGDDLRVRMPAVLPKFVNPADLRRPFNKDDF